MKDSHTESRSFQFLVNRHSSSKQFKSSLGQAVMAVIGASLVMGTIGGCARGTGAGANGVFSSPVSTEGQPAASEMMAAPHPETFSLGSEVNSRILLSPEKDGVGIELVDSAGENRVKISSSGGAPLQYEVNRLEAPPRIVVDLKGKSNSPTRIFDVADSGLISQIRIGSHPDKSRLVLDLVPDIAIEHTVSEEAPDGSSVVVALKGPAGQPAESAAPSPALPEVSEPAIEGQPVAEGSPPVKVEEALPVAEPHVELVDEEDSATLQPVSLDADSKDSPNNAEIAEVPRLTALSIEPLGVGDNVVIAELSSARSFALKRSAPSEYVLKIEGVGLASDVGTTILATPGSGAIRSVRPVVQGNDVLLRIFCSQKANLEARSNGAKIVVASSLGGISEDLRAQAKPDTEVGAAASKPEAAAAPAAASELDEGVSALLEEAPKYSGRLISLDLQDTDIDNALRIIAEVSNLNIIASQDVAGKVTLRLVDVPWDQALDVILKTNGLDKVQEGNVVRIAPIEKLRLEREQLKQLDMAKDELEPLQVKYIRISYAKAAELKPLVEGVLSERGSVAYDERTNQLIVKDIFKGVKNVAELVAKLDLRTPQVLLETQIVEAARGMLRDLGSEFGFSYIQSPETGNATGVNFPNAVNIGGSVDGIGTPAVAFPAGVSAEAGSAVTFLLESADGTKSLGLRLSALEQEGRARVVSRPAVATTNNKQATIKSVTKIRVKTPDGGLSVATGSGASASSSSAVATEQIEVGIVLNVTPQASPDYFVLLDIDAKSSTLGDPAQAVDGIPPEIERSATSSVLVSSGQTFAMGGIYVIRDNDAVSGVPFLKDIPFFGYLFRRSLVNNSDEELLFFITPRIIEGSFDDAAMRVAS